MKDPVAERERLKRNHHRWLIKNPYVPVSVDVAHAHHVEAAKRRWDTPKHRQRRARKVKIKEIAIWLITKERVQRRAVWKIEEAERSLAYYHEHQAEPRAKKARIASLEKAYRSALSRAAMRLFRRPKLPRVFRSKVHIKLADRLRKRFAKAFGCRRTSAYILGLCGCSLQALQWHLQVRFKPGMTWENRGLRGWHIDHIRPCAAFDLTDPAQQAACFHYSNLQPLWAAENLRKKDRVDKPQSQE